MFHRLCAPEEQIVNRYRPGDLVDRFDRPACIWHHVASGFSNLKFQIQAFYIGYTTGYNIVRIISDTTPHGLIGGGKRFLDSEIEEMSWSSILWTVEDAMALSSALQDKREQRGQAINRLSDLGKFAGARLCYVTGLFWAKEDAIALSSALEDTREQRHEGPKSTGGQPP